MTFEPVLLWRFRCDGDTTRGQCPEVVTFYDDFNEERRETLNTAPKFAPFGPTIDRSGWAHFSEKLLCPKHIAAAERVAHATLDGLPFPDTRDINPGGARA
ncbi:hypothetical protein [Amycolatopsis sp. H20-H5]|uniref:hypothetical protein n=1 Tax=Amycolatopsis sp. H20-H5 TaxID=3046309 RepID=UPI002DBD24C4|nr:hypothetical protein [Amycolatopsis sp. H20-H5]MEC3975101.1 hypothetical protein [Amycolatopsis sp. H20-H5]